MTDPVMKSLGDRLADDLHGALAGIPEGERTPARVRPALNAYFDRPDHIAVEVTAGLVDETAPERGRLCAGATLRPSTAYGAVLLERHRRETAPASA